MSRKSVLLFSFFNLMLKPRAGQIIAPSNQLIALPQHPPAHDREAWLAYWKAQDQPWRTEPEIDKERQEYLAGRRAITPDIKKGIYSFKGVKLNRADVEWLLSTHENGRGPIDWSDERQHKRKRIDLRGADLRSADLRNLPLARCLFGLPWDERQRTTQEKWAMAATLMQEANLFRAHLEDATLHDAHLEGANLEGTFLYNAKFRWTHLEGANLKFARVYLTHFRCAYLQHTNLRNAALEGAHFIDANLGDTKGIGPLVADTQWGNTNLAVIKWSHITMLGDEYEARQPKVHGKAKGKNIRLTEHERAVRANRQLAVSLQAQGLNEDATRFAYRAQVLQKRVLWFQVLQHNVSFKQRGQLLGAWLFSWFLYLLAGYGYRLWRSFLAYALVIIGFTTLYYLLGAASKPSLSLVNALGLSMTSFHGRGFFPGVTQLNDTLTILASIEAFVGLVLEATFIATLTQRFFGK